jgi:hypothetical protein
MNNPITIIESLPVNTFEDLFREYQRQYSLREEKIKEAKRLHLHNPFDIDYFGLQGMVIALIQKVYGLTETQAQIVEAKCYEDYYACYEDYLHKIPSMAQFALDISNHKG